MKQPNIAIVAIGRNEGHRLKACLVSLQATGCTFIYVDSGSKDGSIELAQSLGAEIVELDLSIPFSAARARNAGADRLRTSCAELEYIQFLDGDCLLDDQWLNAAASFMSSHPDFAVVCGRRRERFRDASIYNRLIDLEWDTPIGEAKACGGDALVRVTAFNEVRGFNPSVIAGEEPELCVRLRNRRWRIMRLDAEMTLHDADMHRVSQWWMRAKRAGFAYALGYSLHGARPERHWVREIRSIWFWGIIAPIVIIAFALPTNGLSLIAFAFYLVLAWRVQRYMRSRGFSSRDASIYAASCVLAKLPQAQGVLQFWWNKILVKPAKIIEYKA